MSNRNGKLMPAHRRSKKGPTRYYPRCNRRGCVDPLKDGEHVGLCESCREQVAAILRVSSEMLSAAQESLSVKARESK